MADKKFVPGKGMVPAGKAAPTDKNAVPPKGAPAKGTPAKGAPGTKGKPAPPKKK